MRAASSGEAPKHYPQDSDAVGGDLCVDDPGRGSHDWLAAPGVEPGEQTASPRVVHRPVAHGFPGRCRRIPARFGRRILILPLIGAYAWLGYTRTASAACVPSRAMASTRLNSKSRFLWVVDWRGR